MSLNIKRVLILAALGALAGCQDALTPTDPAGPQFAQGDNSTWTVNSLADPGDGTCDDAECTLREAIGAATPGGVVTFAPGLAGPIWLTAGELLIDESLSVVGPGAANLFIDAHGASKALLITDGIVENVLTVEISGLTITGGGSVSYGAGVENHEALALRDAVITNNHAGSFGGGIYHWEGDLTLLNTTVSNNAAGDSESRYAEGGGIYTNAPLTLVGSTLTSNWARLGGGITTINGELDVLRSTISGNSALTGAGAYVLGPGAQLRSSTIADQVYSNSLVTFANAIVGGGCVAGIAGSMTSLGHNVLVGCDPVAPASTDIVLAAGQLFTDVLEPELKDNGGPTYTHALLARGRAVDAGYCPAETEDQRGFARPVDYPLAPNAADGCDIGAFELQAPVVPVADLMVSQAVDKTSVKQGELLTYFVRVQNLGPDDAANVVVTDVLSSGVTFVAARGNKGSFTAPPAGETGTVTWNIGDLLDQGNEVAEIQVTVLVKGKTTITSTTAVTGDVADPNLANNSAAITVSIAAGTGGKGGPKR